MKRIDIRANPRVARLVAALMLAFSGGANAFEFETETGWRGSFNNTVSIGASWRAEEADAKLYSRGDGLAIGKSDGRGATNTDSGTLNWGKGDRFSTLVKLVSELALSKGDLGGFVRVKAWYDQALGDEGVRRGNGDNGYRGGRPLQDDSQPALNKFQGVALLDAYAYDTFDLGDMPLQIRAGRQVVNWGESLFIQGLNQLNPLDVSSLRKPGTEIKEAFLPVWSAYANLGIGGGMSAEGFYQFKWEPTIIDSCGGYWAPIEFSFTTSPGSHGCNSLITTTSAALGNAASISRGLSLPYGEGKDGKDSGQWGLAFRAPVEALDAELGIYAMRINSRVPIVSVRTGTFGTAPAAARTTLNPLSAHEAALGAAFGVRAARGFWEYPDKINIYGLSLATNVAGWSVGAEVSHTPNQPVQINGNDLLAALLQGAGPMGAALRAATAQGAGVDVHGHDRIAKTQLQFNTIKILPRMLGATQGTLAAEAGFQWNDVGGDRRYGRGFIFGNGAHPLFGGGTCLASNPQPDGCQDDGYVTDFSWGYRAKAQLDYPGAFGGPFTLTPSVFFGHDVYGYSSDAQFVEGRMALGLGLKADYQKKFAVEVGYTTYANDAKFDMFRDRDYFSISLSTTF